MMGKAFCTVFRELPYGVRQQQSITASDPKQSAMSSTGTAVKRNE